MLQWVGVQPSRSYRFSAWALLNDSAVQEVYLEVSWWSASGSLVLISSSPASLTGSSSEFRLLDTGHIVSPEAARSARLRAIVRTSGAFGIHFDDFTFEGTVPLPPPTNSPAPTPVVATPTPAPTAPPVTPKPTAQPTQRPSKPLPSSTAVPEPPAFHQLTNGGFEQLRLDGTPYGWHKHGGEMTTTGTRTEGSHALKLTSNTDATKWAQQTVDVIPGAHYEASVDVLPDAGVEAVFLRISWYGATDGTGIAIDNIDSPQASPSSHFQFISTGVVEAPPGALTAKIKLMLRPAQETGATAYFDATTFVPTTKPVENIQDGESPSPLPRTSGSRQPGAGVTVQSAGNPPVPALGTSATPVRLANVRLPDKAKPVSPPSGGGGRPDWAIALAITAALVTVAGVGTYEIWRRNDKRPPA